jgi:glyoxylase I family protein
MISLQPIGKIHHVCIQTSNFDKAFDFYTKALGLEIIKPPFDYKGERRITWLNAGSIVIELNGLRKGTEEQGQSYSSFGFGPSHISFVVDNLENTIKRLEAHNVHIVKHPFLPATGDPHQPLVAFIEGPDNDHIELREPDRI